MNHSISRHGHTTRAGRIPVSVIVMTKDEAENLGKCLASLSEFSEVFVVDSSSTDGTVEIARACGAEVIDFEWNGRYPKKKQWALDNLPLNHEWVLYVDADEQVPPALLAEVRALMISGPSHRGYFIGFDYVFLGRVLRHGHRIYKLILLDRRVVRFPDVDDLEATNMWEVEGHYQPLVDGSLGKLRSRMLHNDHDSFFDWIDRHNRYSDWEAVVQQHAMPYSESQMRWRQLAKGALARMPMRGMAAFLQSYIARLGFLDGRPGLHFGLARGFYYWQIGVKTYEKRAVGRRTDPGGVNERAV